MAETNNGILTVWYILLPDIDDLADVIEPIHCILLNLIVEQINEIAIVDLLLDLLVFPRSHDEIVLAGLQEER